MISPELHFCIHGAAEEDTGGVENIHLMHGQYYALESTCSYAYALVPKNRENGKAD